MLDHVPILHVLVVLEHSIAAYINVAHLAFSQSFQSPSIILLNIHKDHKSRKFGANYCSATPIPQSEDIFVAMAGGVTFSKLDLSHAYLQLQLEESAKDYLVINTNKGLFEYTRMPFGITAAPAIFQRTMNNILQGLKHVCVYTDDILITGELEEGWPEQVEEEQLKPFTAKKGELSIESGCVLWGTRVIVPAPLCSKVMDELHEGHPGIGRIKSFARGYV